MLASDMDGTLLDSAHEISRENVEAIRYFTENGGLFTIATGRMVSSITRYAEQININAPVIAINGAVIYDLARGRLLSGIHHEADMPEVIDGLKKNFPELGIEFFVIDEMYICQGNDITRQHSRIINKPYIFTDVRGIVGDCMKVNLTQEPGYLADVEHYLNDRYADAFYLTYSNPQYLEVMRAGVSKGRGLETVADIANISHERAYAIGDGLNDIEMLESAGFSFAPANAEKQVRDIADVIVSSNDGHAVRDAIIHIERRLA